MRSQSFSTANICYFAANVFKSTCPALPEERTFMSALSDLIRDSDRRPTLDPRVPIAELIDRTGPDCPRQPFLSLASDRLYCLELLRRRKENFTILSVVAPPELREDLACVYAFCRWSDDLGDEAGPSLDAAAQLAYRQRLLSWWRSQLVALFSFHGARDAASKASFRSLHPVLRALLPTIEKHQLPIEPFNDLITAFQADQTTFDYQSFDQLLEYCRCSANPVGNIVLRMGGFTPETHCAMFLASDQLCSALQLTNHLQDVRRDLLDRNRIYLPKSLTNLTRETLIGMQGQTTPAHRAAFFAAVEPLWNLTLDMYRSAAWMPASLGPKLGPMVGLMINGGIATHQLLKRHQLNTLWQRHTLSAPRASLLIFKAIANRALWFRAPMTGGPQDQAFNTNTVPATFNGGLR
jgi:phytoene/squalene synthetase